MFKFCLSSGLFLTVATATVLSIVELPAQSQTFRVDFTQTGFTQMGVDDRGELNGSFTFMVDLNDPDHAAADGIIDDIEVTDFTATFSYTPLPPMPDPDAVSTVIWPLSNPSDPGVPSNPLIFFEYDFGDNIDSIDDNERLFVDVDNADGALLSIIDGMSLSETNTGVMGNGFTSISDTNFTIEITEIPEPKMPVWLPMLLLGGLGSLELRRRKYSSSHSNSQADSDTRNT